MTTFEIPESARALAVDADRAEHAAVAGEVAALSADRVAPWRERAVAWLDSLPAGREITADDLVDAVGLPAEGVHRNNAVGGLFGTRSRAGRLEWTGDFRRSEREIGHGNLQRVWRVAGELSADRAPAPRSAESPTVHGAAGLDSLSDVLPPDAGADDPDLRRLRDDAWIESVLAPVFVLYRGEWDPVIEQDGDGLTDEELADELAEQQRALFIAEAA